VEPDNVTRHRMIRDCGSLLDNNSPSWVVPLTFPVSRRGILEDRGREASNKAVQKRRFNDVKYLYVFVETVGVSYSFYPLARYAGEG
jgi:hypothetical protein